MTFEYYTNINIPDFIQCKNCSRFDHDYCNTMDTHVEENNFCRWFESRYRGNRNGKSRSWIIARENQDSPGEVLSTVERAEQRREDLRGRKVFYSD